MKFIMDWIHTINFCYVVINVLGLIVLNLFLTKKNVDKKVKTLATLFYVGITIVSFSYMNGLFQSIFGLKYLSVKTYLFVIMLTNLIILFTINKKVKFFYKLANYTLFVTLTIILGATLSIILGNKFDSFYVMDISNAVNFIDLSMVIFILYGILMSIIYIGYDLFENKEEVIENQVSTKQWKLPKLPNIHFKRKTKEKKSSTLPKFSRGLLTPEELFQYNRENGFYIDGVECSIIFEDSNKENIIKNYYILQQDIHAKLVNGYTLEENRMLKNICMKLQVGNISNIDINNISILNKITVEEYNLLKRIF